LQSSSKGIVKYEAVMLKRTMEVLKDAEIKKGLWQVCDKIFYKQGVTDPDYCVLKFTADSGCQYEIQIYT